MYTAGSYEYLPMERVVYGRPVGEVAVEEAGRRGAARALIVSAGTLARETDAIDALKSALGDRFAGLFTGTEAHTPRDTVIACAEAVRDAEADLILTVGGGTAIDTVKAALICLAEGVRDADALGEYRVRVGEDGAPVVPAIKPPPVRQIIVPTTLSGAEFSNLAGVTDPARKIKDGYTAREVGAVAVILDPAITVHTPDWLWLSTGIRAVDHAVETICSAVPQPLTDACALHALHLFADALPRNRREPGDQEGRLQSQLAVWLAGFSINRVPYGASHGIGHQLGAVAGVPHGHCSCVMLPAVMRYNASVNGERQAWVAKALGRPGDAAADVLHDFIASLGMPTSLREVGVERGELDRIAEGSMENHMVRANPRRLTDPAQVREILDMAW